ncbi:MAG: hypothetical protein QME93_12750, partial [Bacillota bacterium]|nr:hypothetical protein [Bacillota bacterium]
GNLDSRTGDELMELFSRLNRERGITILQVTHDERMARYSRRIVRLQDGQVVSDAPPDGHPPRGGSAEGISAGGRDRLARGRSSVPSRGRRGR